MSKIIKNFQTLNNNIERYKSKMDWSKKHNEVSEDVYFNDMVKFKREGDFIVSEYVDKVIDMITLLRQLDVGYKNTMWVKEWDSEPDMAFNHVFSKEEIQCIEDYYSNTDGFKDVNDINIYRKDDGIVCDYFLLKLKMVSLTLVFDEDLHSYARRYVDIALKYCNEFNQVWKFSDKTDYLFKKIKTPYIRKELGEMVDELTSTRLWEILEDRVWEISTTLFSLYNMKFIQKDKQWLKAVKQYQTTNIEKENGEWIQSFDNSKDGYHDNLEGNYMYESDELHNKDNYDYLDMEGEV